MTRRKPRSGGSVISGALGSSEMSRGGLSYGRLILLGCVEYLKFICYYIVTYSILILLDLMKNLLTDRVLYYFTNNLFMF